MSIRKHFDPVELRGDIEREIIDVLDAVAMHQKIGRIELAERILREWTENKLHECSLVMRIAGSKGSPRNCRGTTGDDE